MLNSARIELRRANVIRQGAEAALSATIPESWYDALYANDEEARFQYQIAKNNQRLAQQARQMAAQGGF